MKVIRIPLRALALGVFALVVGGVSLAMPLLSTAGRVPLTPAEQAVRTSVQALWQRLDDAAATGDAAALPPLFDLQTAAGRASLKHAQARLAFVQAWARARGVRWLTPRVSVRTPAIRFQGQTEVRVTAIISEGWAYTYGGPAAGPATDFGIGREHYMTLEDTPTGWKIAQDWFTDPLDQDTRIPGPAVPQTPIPPAVRVVPSPRVPVAPTISPRGYNRAGAVRYADTYCGAAPGCGNHGRYNPRFFDYNTDGGDCTNFVSQALNVGGGLVRNPTWTFDGRTGEGTAAWVKAPALLGYLVDTGLARVIARGRYSQVAGSVGDLSPGDIIGYIEGGKVVHLALVVGFDPHGYALVDSHTADRYDVPWDIGWDRGASFILVHITDGTRLRPAAAPLLLPAPATGCGA